MGRRGVGGGNDMRELRRAMESCGKGLSTAEEIVGDLCSSYGKYARMSRQTLVRNVRRVLDDRNNTKKRVKEDEEDEEEDDDDSDEGMKKRRRLVDEKEEDKLQEKKKKKSVSSCSSSTSEDPSFDFTSDTLRGGYVKMMNSSTKLVLARVYPPPPLSGGGGSKRGGGPTFKDFGGIKKVLDELDKYILTPPDEAARAEILSLVAQRLRLEGSFDMKRIARLTPEIWKDVRDRFLALWTTGLWKDFGCKGSCKRGRS